MCGGVGDGEPCTEGGATDAPSFRAGGARDSPVFFVGGLLLKVQMVLKGVSGVNLAIRTVLW